MANLNALINISIQNQALLQQVNAQFNQLNQTVSQTQQQVSRLGNGFRNLFAGLVSTATLRQAVVQFEALERAETNLADSLTRNTKLSDNFRESLRRQATELGRASGFTRAQVTQFQGYTAVLGLAEDQTLRLNEAISGLAQRSTAGVDEIAKSVQRAIISGEISETLGPLIGASPAEFRRLTQSQRADYIADSQSPIFSRNNFSRLFSTLNDSLAEVARTINSVLGPAINLFTSILGKLNENRLTGPAIGGTAAIAGLSLMGSNQFAKGAKRASEAIKTLLASLIRIGVILKNGLYVGVILLLVQAVAGLVHGLSGVDDARAKVFDNFTEGIDGIGKMLDTVYDWVMDALSTIYAFWRTLGESIRNFDFSNFSQRSADYAGEAIADRAQRKKDQQQAQKAINVERIAELEAELSEKGIGLTAEDIARREREIELARLKNSGILYDQVRVLHRQSQELSDQREILEKNLEIANKLLAKHRKEAEEINGKGEINQLQYDNLKNSLTEVGELEEKLKDLEIERIRLRKQAIDLALEYREVTGENYIRDLNTEGRADILAKRGTFSDIEGQTRKLQISTLKQRIKLTNDLIRLSEQANDAQKASQLRAELVSLEEQVADLEEQLPALGVVIEGNMNSAFDSLIDGT